jgi:hypothetical protein
MISALNVARVAKLVALLGFVFPWVLVSCSGQPVGRLTGVDLATGGLTVPQADGGGLQHLHPNLWVLLSLAAVIFGLVASFLIRGRQALLAMGAASVVALAASGIGIASASSDPPADALRPPQRDVGAPPPAGSASAVQVQLQYGYFINVAGLLVAIGACGVALTGRSRGAGSG